jgi:hypothetical protein
MTPTHRNELHCPALHRRTSPTMNQPAPAEDENPYRPPRPEPPPSPPPLPARGPNPLFSSENESLEEWRETYGPQEASIKAIGLYLYLAAGASLFNFLITLSSPEFNTTIAARLAATPMSPTVFKIIMVGVGLLFGSLTVVIATFLRLLYNWARWVVIVFTSFNVIMQMMALNFVQANPQFLGPYPGFEWTVLGFFLLFLFYILYILLSASSPVVCSARYRAVVAATPALRPRPGVRDKIFLGMMAGLLLTSMIEQLITNFPRK